MGEFRSVIAVSERDVSTFAEFPLFDHVASFVAILDVFDCNSDEPSV